MFYHRRTESEIVSLRAYLARKKRQGNEDDIDRWIRMIATNRLTGHSPGFFSVYTLPPNQAISPSRQIKINRALNQRPEYRDVRSLILRKSRSLLRSLSDQERMYYRDIQYIATPREVAYYNSLSESGKDVWLASFWSKHNLTEFARRLETAENRFRRQRTPGVRTDRGRIYVKYGEPDAIEQKVIETQIRPREYWHYYSSGYVYVFVDIRGDGNYRLAYTNNKDEPPTGFESYLTPEEQEQWGQ